MKSDGTPVEADSVAFKVRIRSPGLENCILFEESHQVSMNSSDGIFSLAIGSGTREMSTSFEHGSTLTQALSNVATLPGTLNCVAPATGYVPLPGHGRRVEVSFDEGTGFQTVAQTLQLQSVPYALNADTVQGRTPSDFISRNSNSAALTQANLEGVFASTAYVNELIALIAGQSNLYVRANGLGFMPTAAISYNNQRITNLANPTSAQDAATKEYADKQIGGKVVDVTITNLAAGDSGKFLSWDGTKWVATSTTSDATKLPLMGGSMSGPITMSGNGILQTGRITMNPGHYLHLGAYDDAAEATLIATLSSSHRGAIWYNTTDNVIKHWNGSAPIANGPIADNSVTTAKIADGSVTTSKLFTNSGINRIVATDGTSGSTLAPMACATVGHVLKWTIASGFQCASDESGQWITNGLNIGFTAGSVGIGTTTPGVPLDIKGNVRLSGDNNFPNYVSRAFSDTPSHAGGLVVEKARGTEASPSYVQSGDWLGLLRFRNHTNGQGSTISSTARENHSASAAGSDLRFATTSVGATSESIRMTIGSNGNVGIGTTSPTERLDVNGNIILSGANPILYLNATGGQIRSPATQTLAINTNGAERLRVDSAGNVGIGTTSPSVALDIGSRTDAIRVPNGDNTTHKSAITTPLAGMIRWNTTNSSLEVYNGSAWVNLATGSTIGGLSAGTGTSATPSIAFANDSDTGFFSNGADTIGVSTGGSTRFNFSNAGLSSSTTGGALLTSDAGSATTPTFSFAGDPDTGWFSPAANNLAAATGGAERVRIDNNGNVGIGATSPLTAIQIGVPFTGVVSGWSATRNRGLLIGDNTDNVYFGLEDNGTNNRFALIMWGDDGTEPLMFKTNDSNGSVTERARITGGGSFGLGTTSPYDAT